MRGHNICFCGEIRKIVFELSSLPPLIWNSGHNNLLFMLKIINFANKGQGNYKLGLSVKFAVSLLLLRKVIL